MTVKKISEFLSKIEYRDEEEDCEGEAIPEDLRDQSWQACEIIENNAQYKLAQLILIMLKALK